MLDDKLYYNALILTSKHIKGEKNCLTDLLT